MSGIGSFELILILLIAICVIGPENTQSVIRIFRRWKGKMGEITEAAKKNIDINEEVNTIKQEFQSASDEAMKKTDIKQVKEELNKIVKSVDENQKVK